MEQLTTSTFKEKIFNYETNKDWNFTGKKSTILDFSASWCGPCQQVLPILEELQKENDDIDIYKIDIDEQSELASVFNIKSVPSFLFIPMNGDPQMSTGTLSKSHFEKIIKDVLKSEK